MPWTWKIMLYGKVFKLCCQEQLDVNFSSACPGCFILEKLTNLSLRLYISVRLPWNSLCSPQGWHVCKWNSDTGQVINEYYSSAPQLLLFLENTESSSFDFHFYVFPSTISSPAPILTLVLPNALHRIGAQERVVLRERDDFEVWGKILIVLS